MANTIFKLDGNWGGGRVELFLIPRIYQVDLGETIPVVRSRIYGGKKPTLPTFVSCGNHGGLSQLAPLLREDLATYCPLADSIIGILV